MKRIGLIIAVAVGCMVAGLPTESKACCHRGHRLRAVARVSLRVATAPVRLARKVRAHRCCGCGDSRHTTADEIGVGDCPSGLCAPR